MSSTCFDTTSALASAHCLLMLSNICRPHRIEGTYQPPAHRSAIFFFYRGRRSLLTSTCAGDALSRALAFARALCAGSEVDAMFGTFRRYWEINKAIGAAEK